MTNLLTLYKLERITSEESLVEIDNLVRVLYNSELLVKHIQRYTDVELKDQAGMISNCRKFIELVNEKQGERSNEVFTGYFQYGCYKYLLMALTNNLGFEVEWDSGKLSAFVNYEYGNENTRILAFGNELGIVLYNPNVSIEDGEYLGN